MKMLWLIQQTNDAYFVILQAIFVRREVLVHGIIMENDDPNIICHLGWPLMVLHTAQVASYIEVKISLIATMFVYNGWNFGGFTIGVQCGIVMPHGISYIVSTLVQVMVWCQSGAKPLHEPKLTYWQLYSKEQNSA